MEKNFVYNRELFTSDEQKMVDQLIEAGTPDKIMYAFNISSPAMEHEIQHIIDNNMTKKVVIDSKVEAEMQKKQSETNTNLINTPEEEALWQKKLDEERNLVKEAEVVKEVEAEVKPEKEEKLENVEKMVCPVCSKEFVNKKRFDTHLTNHNK